MQERKLTLPSILIFSSMAILGLYYLMPVVINITDHFRYIYMIGAVAAFGLGILLSGERKLLVSFLVFEVILLMLYKGIWSSKLSFSHYIMPASTFNIFFSGAVYCLNNKDHFSKEMRILFIFLLAVNLLTAITTIIGVRQFPYAVRNSTRADISDTTKWIWRAHNIGNWNYLYGVVFLVPTIVLLFLRGKRKLMWLISLAVVMFCILKAQLTIALFLAIGLVGLMILGNPQTRKGFYLYSAAIILLMLIGLNLERIILFAWKFTNDHGYLDIARKMNTLYMYLAFDSATGNAGERLGLYSMSLSTFLDNPLFGCLFYSGSLVDKIGFHSEICDMLGGIGFSGLAGLIMMFCYWLSSVRQYISSDWQWEAGMIFLTMIFLAVLNPILYAPQIALNVFLMPALIFGQLEKE